MIETLRREGIYLWYYFSVMFELIFPYWAAGIAVGSLISVFGKSRILRTFNILQRKKIGKLGILPAGLVGIASPLCMYGTIPIAASFSQSGMKDDRLAAFMMSSILLNPQLLIYSAALGKTALTIRFILALLCGITAGLLVSFFYTDRNISFFNFTGINKTSERDVDPKYFSAPAEKSIAQYMGYRPLFFDRACINSLFSALCS